MVIVTTVNIGVVNTIIAIVVVVVIMVMNTIIMCIYMFIIVVHFVMILMILMVMMCSYCYCHFPCCYTCMHVLPIAYCLFKKALLPIGVRPHEHHNNVYMYVYILTYIYTLLKFPRFSANGHKKLSWQWWPNQGTN